jgi:NAD+ diphosphatase
MNNATDIKLRYYLFHRNKVVTSPSSDTPQSISHDELLRLCPDVTSCIIPETAVKKHCFAAEFPADQDLPSEYSTRSLRSLLGSVEESSFFNWGRASHLLYWHKTTRHCGSCGEKTLFNPNELARYCPDCNLNFYPVISPCIIVLIHRPGEILLARSPRFPEGLFSTLAGFVEPGESAEQAIHREIYEEVGITVSEITYFKSQPWPFPGQLMLGFFCKYLSGDIRIDNDEICEANWYTRENVPTIPPSGTISGQLIRHHLKKQ